MHRLTNHRLLRSPTTVIAVMSILLVATVATTASAIPLVGLDRGRTVPESVPASVVVDAPDGFRADVLAAHSRFPDDVAATFRFRYATPGANAGTTVANLPDADTVVVAEVTWEPSGTSGWHSHPGPVVVAVTEGSVVVTNADDCVPRTYEAGEAFVDPGQGRIHVAVNASDDQQARASAMFFGVPEGEPATVWAPPADC